MHLSHSMAFSDKPLIQLDLVYLRHKINIVQYYSILFNIIGQHTVNMLADISQSTYDPGWLSWESAGLLSGRSRVQTPAGPTLRVFK